MTVRVRDLSVIRAPGPPPTPTPVAALSVAFLSILQDVALTPQSIVASGGTAPYAFSAVGLPTGVSINPLTGSISGTPTVGGDFTATVTVTDSLGALVAVPVFFSILGDDLFEDTFIRADQPFLMGDQWEVPVDPNYAGASYTGTQLAAVINTNAVTGLTIASIAVAFGPRIFCVPRPLSWPLVLGQSQFAEYTPTVDNSVAGSLTRYGPMCLANPNLGTAYAATIAVEAGAQRIELIRQGPVVLGLGNSAIGSYTIGQRVTLTATVNPGDVTLDVQVDGVSVLNVVDNSAGRLTTGLPGILVLGASAGRSQTLTNFRGGSLARL